MVRKKPTLRELLHTLRLLDDPATAWSAPRRYVNELERRRWVRAIYARGIWTHEILPAGREALAAGAGTTEGIEMDRKPISDVVEKYYSPRDWRGLTREATFREVLAAETEEALNEASLARVWQHWRTATGQAGGSRVSEPSGAPGERGMPLPSFAILTSWRGRGRAGKEEESVEEAEARNRAWWRELLGALDRWGYGYVKLRGHWRECTHPGMDYRECPEEDKQDSIEPSVFVPGITIDRAKVLGKKYLQDGVIYAGPETHGRVAGLYLPSGVLVDYGEFHPNRIARAYSEMKAGALLKELTGLGAGGAGRPFAFMRRSPTTGHLVEPGTEDDPGLPAHPLSHRMPEWASEDFVGDAFFEYVPNSFFEAAAADNADRPRLRKRR